MFKAHVLSKHYFCNTCMKWFSTLKSQKEHSINCKKEDSTAIEKDYAEWGKDINLEQMESIVKEKLILIDSDPGWYST